MSDESFFLIATCSMSDHLSRTFYEAMSHKEVSSCTTVMNLHPHIHLDHYINDGEYEFIYIFFNVFLLNEPLKSLSAVGS